jgi:hypothetical protein
MEPVITQKYFQYNNLLTTLKVITWGIVCCLGLLYKEMSFEADLEMMMHFPELLE